MSLDALDVYQQICEKASIWLRGPLSKRDFASLFKVMDRVLSKKSPSRALSGGREARGMARILAIARSESRALTLRVASYAFNKGAIVLASVASRRALFLTRRLRPLPRPCEVSRPASRIRLRSLEATLWFAMVGMLGYCSFVYASSAVHQAQRRDLANNYLNKALNRSALIPILPLASNDVANEAANEGKLLGFLDIPRIGLSSVVEEGSGPRILLRGVGHMPGTALPGERGNVGLAGHLDAYFSELSKLRKGDILTFRSMTRTYDYDVVSTSTAETTSGKAFSSMGQSTLTLVDYSLLHKANSVGKQLVIIAREMPRIVSSQ